MFHNRFLILLFTLILTILSFFVVWQNINDEPYVLLYRVEAFVQISLASMLLILWLQLAIFIIVGLFSKWLSSFNLIILLWIMINCFLVGFAMIGYISDIEFHQKMFNS